MPIPERPSCPRCGWVHYDPADATPCEPCAAEATATLRTVVGNLIGRYGVSGVRGLLDRFRALESCDRIAPDFGVTGERIRQWRTQLGIMEREWTPHSDCVGMAGARGWAT